MEKLVQQLQIPRRVGTAVSAAAQHSWKSPSLFAPLTVLHALLHTAKASGLIKNGVAAGNLATSMRQQLQDSGVLQQYAAVMAAAAADLRSDAAALGTLWSEELSIFSARYSARDPTHLAITTLVGLHSGFRGLWGVAGETDAANSISWLCDPSRHAEAAMQLCTAGLQHVGSVLKHVLPAVQQSAPEEVQELLQAQQDRLEAMLGGFRCGLLESFGCGSGADVQDQQLQQLFLSPALLPWVASLLVLNAAWASQALQACDLAAADGRQGPEGSSSARGSARSSGTSSTRSSGTSSACSSGTSSARGGESRLKASWDVSRSSSTSYCSSSRGGGKDYNPTPCQLQLLELLGLAPLLEAVGPPGLRSAMLDLATTLTVCGAYNEAAIALGMEGKFHTAWSQQQSEPEDQQRWQFEQQLCTLLPSVLLPCANKLLRSQAAMQVSSDTGIQGYIYGLLDQSNRALSLPMMCRTCCPANSWCRRDMSVHRPPHSAWMGEVLGGALQLADHLLLQQQQQPHSELHAQAAAAEGSSTSTAQGTSSGSTWLAMCATKWPQLLSLLVDRSSTWLHRHSSTATLPAGCSSSIGAAAGEAAAAAVPVVAERFVMVCTALEAGLRVATAALQSGTGFKCPALIRTCLHYLFPVSDNGDGNNARSPLVLHMGFRGPQALVLEQRRLYSLLSTVQKLSRCQAGAAHQMCWGQLAANACCWEVARATVGLLQGVQAGAVPAAAGAGAAAAGAVPPGVVPAAAATLAAAGAVPAAAGQQGLAAPGAMARLPAVELLPSLVLLGRCFLAWTQQLQQLLATGSAAQPEVPREVCLARGAACMCIPGWQQRLEGGVDENATPAPCRLERLVPRVATWVDGITCPVARAALAAAVGGELQQFKQQLEVLSAAQAALRENECTATLRTLVRELQATGVMLCSIAVPHFCNNAACVNVSGPTDVQLVSGRSCLCAGCCTARYCGRVCQRQAWQQHKPVCKALKAAAAAAAASDTMV